MTKRFYDDAYNEHKLAGRHTATAILEVSDEQSFDVAVHELRDMRLYYKRFNGVIRKQDDAIILIVSDPYGNFPQHKEIIGGSILTDEIYDRVISVGNLMVNEGIKEFLGDNGFIEE